MMRIERIYTNLIIMCLVANPRKSAIAKHPCHPRFINKVLQQPCKY
jgi:hypothetical protein